MRIFVVLMKDGSTYNQYETYVASFTEHSKAEDFIREKNGDTIIIHRVDRDYDGFHYYIPGYIEEIYDTGIYGILTEEIK